MNERLRRPSERRCENCGRTERWDDAAETWRTDDDPGKPYCIHEWDINGAFVPYEQSEA
jgi:hypothetical protein